MRTETRTIVNNYYTKEEIMLFKKFAKVIDKEYRNKEKQRIIWEYDQKIGGLGGYAAPLNPTVNLFNRLGDYRNVFRSLQYARSDMYYCNRARHIIIDAALHVETLVKLTLSKNKIIKFIYNKREFGRNIAQLYNEGIINEDLYDRLSELRKLLNYAKHDTDSNRDNTFDSEDAIVFYFETRIIGNELLKILKHPSCGVIYNIDDDF